MISHWLTLGQALKKSQSEHNGAWPDLHAQRRWTKQARSPPMHFLPSWLFCVALVLCSCFFSRSPIQRYISFTFVSLMRFALLWDSNSPPKYCCNVWLSEHGFCTTCLLDAAYLLTRSTVLLRDSLSITLHVIRFMILNTSALIIFCMFVAECELF